MYMFDQEAFEARIKWACPCMHDGYIFVQRSSPLSTISTVKLGHVHIFHVLIDDRRGARIFPLWQANSSDSVRSLRGQADISDGFFFGPQDISDVFSYVFSDV